MVKMAERVIWLFCDIFILYYYLFIWTPKTDGINHITVIHSVFWEDFMNPSKRAY